VIGRWLRRNVVGDKRERLVQDIDRAGTYLAMVLYEGRAMGAPETVDAATALMFWRVWQRKVEVWLSESEA
jgi:hypothetical protein